MSDEIIKRKTDSAIRVHVDENERVGHGLIEAFRRNPEEMGQKLMTTALGRVEKQFAEEVLRQIEELVKHKSNLLNAIDKTAAEVKLTERRLAAIDAGEFKIGWNGKITYNEAILNF
jgi:hypothetical protein